MSNILHVIPEEEIQKDHFLAYIEISAHSKNKYEYDEQAHCLRLDRILFTSTHYPHNYGFIPRTWGLDEDPLDVMVITSEPVLPASLMRCRPIGVLEMKDSGKVDEKIIAIPFNDPTYNGYRSIHELPTHIFEEMRHFFTVYKTLEHKKTSVLEVMGRKRAEEIISESIVAFRDKFGD